MLNLLMNNEINTIVQCENKKIIEEKYNILTNKVEEQVDVHCTNKISITTGTFHMKVKINYYVQ